jgi:hypothetical protein
MASAWLQNGGADPWAQTQTDAQTEPIQRLKAQRQKLAACDAFRLVMM